MVKGQNLILVHAGKTARAAKPELPLQEESVSEICESQKMIN
jgi:hypothetical protein